MCRAESGPCESWTVINLWVRAQGHCATAARAAANSVVADQAAVSNSFISSCKGCRDFIRSCKGCGGGDAGGSSAFYPAKSEPCGSWGCQQERYTNAPARARVRVYEKQSQYLFQLVWFTLIGRGPGRRVDNMMARHAAAKKAPAAASRASAVPAGHGRQHCRPAGSQAASPAVASVGRPAATDDDCSGSPGGVRSTRAVRCGLALRAVLRAAAACRPQSLLGPLGRPAALQLAAK